MNQIVSKRILWTSASLGAIFFHLAFIFPLSFFKTPIPPGKIAISANPSNSFKSIKISLVLPPGELKEISPSLTKKVSKSLSNKKISAIAQEGKNSKIPLKAQPRISHNQEFKKAPNQSQKNSPINSKPKDEVITAPPEGKDSVVQDTSADLSQQKNLIASWQSQVIGHLSRFKKYPQIALDKNKEGEVIVYVVIDKNGKVLSTKLVKSAQEFSLDNEALDLLKRASPLPKPPIFKLKNQRVEFILPVDFNLKQYLKTRK